MVWEFRRKGSSGCGWLAFLAFFVDDYLYLDLNCTRVYLFLYMGSGLLELSARWAEMGWHMAELCVADGVKVSWTSIATPVSLSHWSLTRNGKLELPIHHIRSS